MILIQAVLLFSIDRAMTYSSLLKFKYKKVTLLSNHLWINEYWKMAELKQFCNFLENKTFFYVIKKCPHLQLFFLESKPPKFLKT